MKAELFGYAVDIRYKLLKGKFYVLSLHINQLKDIHDLSPKTEPSPGGYLRIPNPGGGMTHKDTGLYSERERVVLKNVVSNSE